MPRRLLRFQGVTTVAPDHHSIEASCDIPWYESAPKLPSKIGFPESGQVCLSDGHVFYIEIMSTCITSVPSTDHIWKVVVTIWKREYTVLGDTEEEETAVPKSYQSKALVESGSLLVRHIPP